AEYQANLALASSLAAQADLEVNQQLDLALLLGVEAIRIQDTPQARGSLLRGLMRSPGLTSILGFEPGTLFGAAFSPDGKTLAGLGEIAGTGQLIVWDLTQARPQAEAHPAGQIVRSVAFSPDGKTVVTGG